MLFPARPVALLVAVATLFTSHVQALPKVTRVGKYLYQEDGTRFYIKGVAYQEQGEVTETTNNDFGEPSTFTDPLALGDACARDVQLLSAASVNTVRVYSVNSSLNHDACMKTFNDAGIYTIIDLSLPSNGSIERVSPSWSTNLLDQYLRTIDTFSKYDNVLAYNIGNEVVLSDSTQLAPYLKAATRDIKAYLKSKNLNALVGYAAINGGATFRDTLRNYLSCESEALSIDIYGLNTYQWCGDSTFEASYATLTTEFANYNVVAYFGEYGCISAPPRLWTESAALYSAQMTDVWSGGIAFSYFPARSAAGEFGMVAISADGKTVTPSADWTRLVTQYNAVAPQNTPAQADATPSVYDACPVEATFLASNTLPGTPNEQECGCLADALSCQFTPVTADYSKIAGELIDTGCNLLGTIGGTCTDIGGNGQTGVYGRIAGCDPTVKLSYIMSQYYEGNNKNAAACSFAGNGTVNARSTASAASAASSCVASPTATFIPSAPPSLVPGSGGKSSGNNGGSTGGSNGGQSNGGGEGTSNDSNSNNNSGATSVGALVGAAAMAIVGVTSAVLTLS